MRKITLLMIAFLGSIAMNAQTVLFEDDFEAYNDFIIAGIGDWTLTDLDEGSTYGFQDVAFTNSGYVGSYIVFNSTMTTPPMTPSAGSNWAAHSGVKCITAFAAVPDETPEGHNNDWLISPKVTLVAANNTLTFWAKSANATFSLDYFNVAVSTTDVNTTSFTIIAADQLATPATEWVKFTYNLDDYASQDVYIAINYVGADQFGFQIDDFTVSEGTLGIEDVQIAGFKYFYTPSTNELTLSANESISHLNLYNILGQQVISKKLSATDEVVSLAALKTGVYLAKVEVSGKLTSFKIVKR